MITPCKDHLGNIYSSKGERANAYHLTRDCINARLKKGWSLEQALTTPATKLKNNNGGKLCKDHLGNKYPSKTAMANAYGLSRDCLKGRLRNGWSLEKALTTPKSKNSTTPKKCTDHVGNTFKSKSAMARHYNINVSTFDKRIANNWSLKDALTIPVNKKHENKIINVDYLPILMQYLLAQVDEIYKLDNNCDTAVSEFVFMKSEVLTQLVNEDSNLQKIRRKASGQDMSEIIKLQNKLFAMIRKVADLHINDEPENVKLVQTKAKNL